MAHKVQNYGHPISKSNTNVKVSKSNKSTFVKIQIKSFINGTKSRDYSEIQSHCITLIKQFHFSKSIYRHLHNWLHVELNLAINKFKLVNVNIKNTQTHNQNQETLKQHKWKKTKKRKKKKKLIHQQQLHIAQQQQNINIQQSQKQSNKCKQTHNERTQNDTINAGNNNNINNKQEETQIDIHEYNFLNSIFKKQGFQIDKEMTYQYYFTYISITITIKLTPIIINNTIQMIIQIQIQI